MSKIILVVSSLIIAACGSSFTQHNVPVSKGDPNRRERPPIRREKATDIQSKFAKLQMTIQCPTDCAKDYEDQMQFLNVAYSDFQREKGRIDTISLMTGADISFDAIHTTLTLPSALTQLEVDTALVAQKNVERAERILGGIHLSFPTDRFDIATIQKALGAVMATNNARRLRPLATKVHWIDFSGGDTCTNGTWTVDRATFENNFDKVFIALQLCLQGGH